VTLDHESRRVLLQLARSALEVAVGTTRDLAVLENPALRERRGAFVTLTRRGVLRGCIGRVESDAPLATVLPEVARLAALSDPRFSPVLATELAEIRIEISLLTVPTPLREPLALVVGRDGVIVSARGRRGLLLPQVAAEYGWSNQEFLARACAKAGLSGDAWRAAGVRVATFQAEVFAEPG